MCGDGLDMLKSISYGANKSAYYRALRTLEIAAISITIWEHLIILQTKDSNR